MELFVRIHLVRSLLLVLVCNLMILPAVNPSETEATTDELEGQKSVELSEDRNLSVQVVYSGLEFPSNMAFLGPDDILVLEKNKGTVHRIVDGKEHPEPLLDVNVATTSEEGMLGITVAKNVDTADTTYVFLYYTEAQDKDGGEPIGNHLYRYELKNNKLVNPVLLLDFPSTPGQAHNGGSLIVGPDNNIYVTVGDVGFKGNIQEDASSLDGRSGVIRSTLDGQPVPEGQILGEEHPLDMYYAYGLRNSFGIDFDPVTGNLWDTENGPSSRDEINLVEPGFNSGWKDIQGLASDDDNSDPDNLLDFSGRGKYSDPEFVWADTPVGPTALKFLHSDKLGKQYENDLFVGDFHRGNLYNFNLNEDRTALSLNGLIQDKTAENDEELAGVIFGQGFGGITDIEVGPDGYLYILALYLGGDNCRESEDERKEQEDCVPYSSTVGGTIFRILPTNMARE
jgi:aldose sugar dehydrogenase